MIDRERFCVAYRQAVGDVMRFVTSDRQELLARHNVGLRPEHIDLRVYLQASERRYVRVIEQFNARHPAMALGEVSVLDIGGFLGALPLALARCGVEVTLAEEYDYYHGAFDELKQFLERSGVDVWAADFTQPLPEAPERRYTLITNMAMLEHLPSSPKILLENIRAVIEPDGLLVVDVPNIAYWPNRLKALLGQSVHQPLEFMYESEPPFLGHHREYTADELTAVLSWSGFEVLLTDAFNYTPPLRSGSPYRRTVNLLLNVLPSRALRNGREVVLAVATPAPDGAAHAAPSLTWPREDQRRTAAT